MSLDAHKELLERAAGVDPSVGLGRRVAALEGRLGRTAAAIASPDATALGSRVSALETRMAAAETTLNGIGRSVRGRVDAAGTVAGGAGFTVTKTGTGLYTVTFSTAFGAVPAIIPAGVNGEARLTGALAGSFTVATFAAGVATDLAFHFLATAV